MIVSSFLVQANVITIINFNRKTFIVQATGVKAFSLAFCKHDEVLIHLRFNK